jgi:trans-2,3-dihydro-3-hydroxyanthranilate isomerase
VNQGTQYEYRIVDVFTRNTLEGNPLAVLLNGKGLDDGKMQKIAREFNLSETVFLFAATRPDCAAKLRIFTPFRELPFAGHPTVGASFVLLAEGLVPRDTEQFILEENVGPVPIRIEAGVRPLIWMTTPPIEEGPVFDLGLCAKALGLEEGGLLPLPPQLLTAGNPCVFVPVKDRDTVDSASPSSEHIAKLKTIYPHPLCVFVFTPVPEGAYSRMFAPDHGIYEDPATGSATGPLAAYMMRHQLAPSAAGSRFWSEQGTKMGRRSILHIAIRGEHGTDGIDVGGHVAPFAGGVLQLDAGANN